MSETRSEAQSGTQGEARENIQREPREARLRRRSNRERALLVVKILISLRVKLLILNVSLA